MEKIIQGLSQASIQRNPGGDGVSGSVLPKPNESFDAVLERTKGSQAASLDGQGLKFLEDFVRDWSGADIRVQKEISKLPDQYKDVVKLQVLVNNLQMKSEIASKAGEAFASTVRRVQQLGSG